MKSTHKFIACLGITAFLCFSAPAQSTDAEMNHFSEDGVAFDYPDGWSITDESTPEAIQLALTRKGSSVQIMIVVKRDITLRKDLPAAKENFAEPLVKKVATKVGGAVESADVHLQVGTTEAEGVRLHGAVNKQPRTGEVFWLRIHLRLISLAFVRSDADESQGSAIWQTIRSSLNVDAPVMGALTIVQPPGTSRIEGGVLNGKALQLPRPDYPRIARQAHASGTVIVQVVIDEQGNVSAAHAISGHPLLLAVCVAAARQAKFSPTTLEGEPVKVTGVITYNFVAR